MGAKPAINVVIKSGRVGEKRRGGFFQAASEWEVVVLAQQSSLRSSPETCRGFAEVHLTEKLRKNSAPSNF